MTIPAEPPPDGPSPSSALVEDLDRLRRRAAKGSGRVRVSLDQIALATGIPRSTVHSYVQGRRLPPADALDLIVLSLGATASEQAHWAELLETAASAPTSRPVEGTRPAPSVPRLLPAAPMGFVGRHDDLARVDDLLSRYDASDAAGAPMVVALTGLGGVGKTAMALRWAHANAARFPDGQLWVDLRGYSTAAPLDPADALERLLRAVGVGTAELPPDVDSRADLFRSAVAGSRMLLVLDNARNAAQVLPLLPGAEGSLTLVTSRDSLRALGVSVGAARVALGRLSHADSVALMTAELADDTAEAVLASGVVNGCDGLPLAIRILRERLSPAGPDDVHRLADVLGRDRRALLDSLDLFDESLDVSVRGAFDLSYEALTPDAARLFRRLPLCLASTFPAETASALIGGQSPVARRALDQLVAAHLLDSAGAGLVRLHDLVADYARSRFDSDEDAAARLAARTEFYDHLLDRCEQMAAQRVPFVPWCIARPDRREPVEDAAPADSADWVVAHVDLLTAVVNDPALRQLPGYAYSLAERVWRVLHALGSVTGVLDALAGIIDDAEERGDLAVAVELASLRGVGFGRAIELDEAERCFRRAVDLSARLGPQADSSRDQVNLARVRRLRGDTARAIEVLARIQGPGRSGALIALFQMYLYTGDVAAATSCVAELDAAHADEPRWSYTRVADEIDLMIMRGDWSAARAGLPRLGAAAHDAVDSGLVVRAHLARARIGARFGELADAEDASVAAVDAARAFGLRGRRLAATAVVGEILVLGGREAEAVSLLTPALVQTRRLGLRYAECRLGAVLARALTATGRTVEAGQENARAAAVARGCGYALLGREIADGPSEPMSRAIVF